MPELDAAGVDALLSASRTWLAETSLLPDEPARRALAARLDAVTTQREQLRCPLYVVLVGGTGVGKSTLLNALAGESIAPASAVRPTTSALTAYVHAANELMLAPQVAAGRVATHERAELRDKIILDTPDYDSLDRDHWAVMETALKLADVVVWVTTAQKYADLADAGWLARYRLGRRVVVVLNRADEGIEPAVRDDLRRRLGELGLGASPLLTLSAKRAAAGEDDAGFGKLSRLLAEELDAKQVRALKAENLLAAVTGWLDAAAAQVPSDLDERLRLWRDEAEADYRRLAAELTGRLATRLHADPRLTRHVEYWLGFGFGGPVGALLAALYGLRAVFSPHYPRLWEVSEAPALELAVGADESAALSDRLLAWQARHAARAVDLGLACATGDWAKPDTAALRAAAAGLDDSLRGALGRALQGAGQRLSAGARILSLTLNVPTLLVLLGVPGWAVADYWMAWMAHRAAQVPPWQILGVVKRRARRFLGQVSEFVGEAVDAGLRGRLVGRLSTRLEALHSQQRQLAELRREAGRLESASAGT
ncbi:MAG: 50S ribosome-binding GTPase [Armatimonadetes bacterium]|nr:50S ribosome-binding GTPase [Armatimonadota bacterium]